MRHDTLSSISLSPVINIKTEQKTKAKAQELASEMGMSLTTLLNTYLKQFIRTRKVVIDLGEEPSDRLMHSMRQAQKDRRAGKASPVFDTAEESIAWLRKQGV